MMKRYQIALLSFALGIFTITYLALFLSKETPSRDVVEVKPSEEFRTLLVFFPNSRNDPNFLNCDKTYPVERVLGRLSDNSKSALGEFAYLVLTDLIRGPTEQEVAKGFFTLINEGTKVQRVIIENGIASVDFDNKLDEYVGGSCKVQAIRSQITETLLQFPEITKVIISINGESESILQP